MNASYSNSRLGASLLSALAAFVAPGAGRALPRAGRSVWLSRAAGTVRLWRKRARERRELMSLDDRMLRDIGLSRGVIEAEGRKPFWRA